VARSRGKPYLHAALFAAIGGNFDDARKIGHDPVGILQCPGILGRDDVDDDGTSAAPFSFSALFPQ
jgi:hypothetical protein